MIFSHFSIIIFSMKNIVISFISDKEETISNFMLEKGFSSSNIFHEIEHKFVLQNSLPVRDKNSIVKIGDKIEITLIPESNELPLNSAPGAVAAADGEMAHARIRAARRGNGGESLAAACGE